MQTKYMLATSSKAIHPYCDVVKPFNENLIARRKGELKVNDCRICHESLDAIGLVRVNCV